MRTPSGRTTQVCQSGKAEVNGAITLARQGVGQCLGSPGSDSNLSYLMPGWWRARCGLQHKCSVDRRCGSPHWRCGIPDSLQVGTEKGQRRGGDSRHSVGVVEGYGLIGEQSVARLSLASAGISLGHPFTGQW